MEKTSTEIMIVRQLPEIEEHLKAVKTAVDEKVNDAIQLVCTEDTLAAVKGVRADLGKDFKALEAKRKEVKKKILEPYEAFEKVYAECVSDAFKKADSVLKSRIDEVENALKEEKTERIKAYYDECCTDKGIDFIPFSRVIPSVNRSVSDKKYKEQCAAYIESVVADLAMIDEQEHANEIRVEYKRTLNASLAVINVAERHRAIEAEKARAEEHRQEAEERKSAEDKIDEIIEEEAFEVPIEEPTEEIIEFTFTVRGTHERICELKSYLIEMGYLF